MCFSVVFCVIGGLLIEGVLFLEFEELSRLLKQKWIDANDPGRVVDPVEARKERLLARDKERAKKQNERHVLTKAMSNHPIPKLFVSRRNVKSPNGFNCSVRQEDVSFSRYVDAL